MPNDASIDEKCSCGATFTIRTSYSTDARRAATEWRNDHQHPDTPEPTAPRVLGATTGEHVIGFNPPDRPAPLTPGEDD